MDLGVVVDERDVLSLFCREVHLIFSNRTLPPTGAFRRTVQRFGPPPLSPEIESKTDGFADGAHVCRRKASNQGADLAF